MVTAMITLERSLNRFLSLTTAMPPLNGDGGRSKRPMSSVSGTTAEKLPITTSDHRVLDLAKGSTSSLASSGTGAKPR